MERLALVCGNGELPRFLIHKIKERKVPLLIIAIKGTTSPETVSRKKGVFWLELGQLGEILSTLRNNKIKKLLLCGGIDKKLLFQGSLLDEVAREFLHSLEDRRDMSILKGLEKLSAQQGIEFIDPYPYLTDFLPGKGILSQRKPTVRESKDIELGWEVAKGLSSVDIGHTVVLKQGIVLAVEAAEGTNSTIERGGRLGGEDTVVVKVARKDHDLRFDPPVIGSETIRICQEVEVSLLAFETGKTVVVDEEKMIQRCNSADISLVGL